MFSIRESKVIVAKCISKNRIAIMVVKLNKSIVT